MRSLAVFSSVLLLMSLLAHPVQALRPEIGYRVTPGDYGIIFDQVTVVTSDSLSLRGWFFPAQDTSGIANDLVGRMIPVPAELKRKARAYTVARMHQAPTILICGGDAGNMSYLISYAYELFTRGFNIFTFDWRGFGDSAPWPAPRDQLVCTEFLSDYDAAIRCVRARPETDPTRIGLVGFSTGGYLSFAMIATRDDVVAVVVGAMPTSFDDLIRVIAPLDSTRHFYAPKDYPRELLPVSAASKVSRPVFLIVGENDNRTPAWMSQKVYDLLKGPRELWIVPGAGHGGELAPELVAHEEFWNKTRSFFAKYFGMAGERR